MKKIYLNEQQLARLLLESSSDNILNEGNLKTKIGYLLRKGIAVSTIVAALMISYNLGHDAAFGAVQAAQKEIAEYYRSTKGQWELIASDVLATVYNAEPSQCNDDIMHTASMFRLNLGDVISHRIIAMERTMMTEFGLKYGDVVKIEGTGKYDGEWQIQDTMNKRFAGQHKIDILVPKSDGLGKWENVKVYKLRNEDEKEKFKTSMAPQLSKKQALAQLAKIKADNFKNV